MVTQRDQMFMMPRSISSIPQGNFEIRGLSPGAYILTVTVFDAGKAFSARQSLDVGNSTLENVTITIYPPMEIIGQIRAEGDKPPDLSNARVSLRPHRQSVYFAAPPSGRVTDETGRFVLASVGPDNYDVSVTGLPDGYYVKSIVTGHEDVLDSGMNLASGAPAPIAITLRPGAGQIDGSVMNGEDKPAPGATVALIPNGEKRREQAQSYKNTTTDQYGRFALKNVDPGDYKLFAWEDVETGAYMDPDFVKPIESQGTPITIREDSHENQQLKWIPSNGVQPRESSQAAAGR